jgi:hypothetical protein
MKRARVWPSRLQLPTLAAALAVSVAGCVNIGTGGKVDAAATSVKTAADAATESVQRFAAQGEPLPPQELRMRVETRQFAADFAAAVRRTADAIAATSNDANVRINALRWKIGASEQARRAALRVDPQLALVDLWSLAVQMDAFLRTGDGANAFKAQQATALETSAALAHSTNSLAARVLTDDAFRRYGGLVRDFASAEPMASLAMQRAPIADRWRPVAAELGAPLNTVGSVPEVIADMSDRLDAYGQQMPDELRWRSDLYMTETGLADSMRGLDGQVARLTDIATERSDRIAAAAAEIRTDTLGTIALFDRRWGETLSTLQVERQALAEDFADTRDRFDVALQREREALARLVAAERIAITADAERISKDLSELVAQRAKEFLRELAIYGYLIVVLLVGIGFGAGLVVGRARTPRRGD